MRTASIVNIGGEITKGEILNSNAAYISKEFTKRGVEISFIIDLPDNYELSVHYLRKVLKDDGIFIFTGGLGGTQDDITRKIISGVFNRKIVIDRERENLLKKVYKKRGREFDSTDSLQASCPEGGFLLENPLGLAYGFFLKVGEKYIFSLPGVPKEMKGMFDQGVIPIMEKEKLFSPLYRSEILTFSDIPEYTLDRKIQKIVSKHKGIVYGTRTSYGIVKVLFESWEGGLENCVSEVEKSLYDNFICRGEQRLEKIIGDYLKEKNLTLSVVESCTAGLLSKLITDVSGSSNYFLGAIVSYNDRVKEELVGVKHETLRRYGAISRESAEEMASGALEKFHSDIAISITGVAGPDGGTEETPVGTVYICLYSKGEKPFIERNIFHGDREIIRMRSVNRALSILFHYLRGTLKE